MRVVLSVAFLFACGGERAAIEDERRVSSGGELSIQIAVDESDEDADAPIGDVTLDALEGHEGDALPAEHEQEPAEKSPEARSDSPAAP
ncbi:MAG: hypothetical protein AAF938_15650 [Myxococcota bacterium]